MVIGIGIGIDIAAVAQTAREQGETAAIISRTNCLALTTVMDDELRPEYDLKRLKLRKVGPGRKYFCGPTVRIEDDVAELFPDSESVNEALRFLIRITKANQSDLVSSRKLAKPVEPTGCG